MGAGAWIDEGNLRFSKGIWCFKSIPFRKVVQILASEFEKAIEVVGEWDAEYLRQSGERSKISS
jgi:hypothetical protein